MAVVPEYLSENKFGKHAAHIFIGAAKKGTYEKEMPVWLFFIFIQEHGGKYNGKAPYNAERSPDQTASAHPDPGSDPAENGLYKIPQDTGNEKQPEQFVETAAFGEFSFSADFLGSFHDYRISLCHTVFYVAHNRSAEPACKNRNLASYTGCSWNLVFNMKDCSQREEYIQKGSDPPYPNQQLCEKIRDQPVYQKEKLISVPHAEQPKYRPQNAVLETDIPIVIPFLSGIIPPFMAVQPFQQLSGEPFHHGSQNTAAYEEKKGIIQQITGSQCHEDCSDSVDQAERSCREASVYKGPVFYGTYHCLYEPSQKRIDQEQP